MEHVRLLKSANTSSDIADGTVPPSRITRCSDQSREYVSLHKYHPVVVNTQVVSQETDPKSSGLNVL